jgi:hypothetical protein
VALSMIAACCDMAEHEYDRSNQEQGTAVERSVSCFRLKAGSLAAARR